MTTRRRWRGGATALPRLGVRVVRVSGSVGMSGVPAAGRARIAHMVSRSLTVAARKIATRVVTVRKVTTRAVAARKVAVGQAVFRQGRICRSIAPGVYARRGANGFVGSGFLLILWVPLVSLMSLMSLLMVSSSPAYGDDSVTLRVQGVPDPGSTSVVSAAQRAVLQAFMKRHPEIAIKRFVMPKVQGGGMDSGPLMAIAAGIPPHVMYVNFRMSSTFVSQGFLEPMEVLLARTLSDDDRTRQVDGQGRWRADPDTSAIKAALEMIRERVPERAWEVVYREEQSGRYPGKHVWAVPTSTLVMALLYRKDLFYEAGLDPERAPADWDELLEMSRKLTVPARQQYGMMIYGGPVISWGAYSFLVSNGARAVRRGEDGLWHAAYDDRGAAEAVEYLWRLAKEPFERDGRVIPGSVKFGMGELNMLWKRGQIAMQFGYLNEELLGDLNPQLVGIAPVPRSPSGTRGSELNCAMLGVFSGSTPEQQLAAMRYIWFVTSEQAQRIRTRVYVENGFGRFVSPNLLEKFGYQRLLRRVPAVWKDVFESTLANGVPEPYGRNTQHIYRYMSAPIHAVLELDLSDTPKQEAVEKIQALLEDSVETANTKLLGNIPAEVMRWRRIVAGGVVLVIAVVFVWGGVLLWRYFTEAAPVSTEGGRGRSRWVAWALLLPALVVTLGWLYVPLASGLVLAFTDYRLVIQTRFVGLDNFAHVLYDAAFWKGLARTIYLVTLVIALGFWPPILLAILLDEVPTATLKYLFRTLFYLPAIISGVIVMFLWKQLYDPGEFGVLNQLLLSVNDLGPVSATVLKWALAGVWLSLIGVLIWLPIKMEEMSRAIKGGLWLVAAAFVGVTGWMILSGFIGVSDTVGRFDLTPLRWIASPEMAMFCVVLPMVWAGAGPGCLLYLAALKTIPSDLYEAADIDGAGFWHKVCYITLPRLKFLIGIQFIAAVVGAFKGGTDFILALTGGGPNDATTILALEIFVRTFMDLEFGIGTAMAWLLGVMLVGLTAYQLKMLTRAEFSAGAAEGKR